jgi:hypothetical protein
VDQSITSFSIILFINSIFLIILILNQNDNSKLQKNTTSNPLIEKITFVSVLIQFSILLIKIKNDYF